MMCFSVKNHLVILFFCFSTLLAKTQNSILNTNASFSFDKDFNSIVEAEKSKFNKNLYTKTQSVNINYDINYLRCDWEIDPSLNYIKGNITYYFKPLSSGLDSIIFNLNSVLTVDSVLYHGNSLIYTQANDLLNIYFSSTINNIDSITVYYQGAPQSSGYGSFTQSTHNGKPIIWTLSEPYGASDWWPCNNSLTDKTDSIGILIKVPQGNKAASNGILISQTTVNTSEIFHWKHKYPIATYLICLAVTNYTEFSKNVPFESSNTLVQNFIYPEDSASAYSELDDIIPVMQLYDSLFGVYPFADEKYGHAEFGWGGGMEHQTMTFVVSFGHELIAHELAHHWFGDKVTCGSWQDIWLNEGFAVYLSGLTYEHESNKTNWHSFLTSRMTSVCSEPDGSVWCDDTTSESRIFSGRLTYNKGAMILHQLRWIIGDSAFFAGIKNYLADASLAYNFARTSDLQSHFEASSNQNLSWYFDDWYKGQGYPSYIIYWKQTANNVHLKINQFLSSSAVSFFELPLPIEFKNGNNDTIIRIQNSSNGEEFDIPISFQVDSVKFDPDHWIINANSMVNSIDEMNDSQNISFFPSPFNKYINVVWNNNKTNQLRLIDCRGKAIFKIDTKNLSQYKIDTSTIDSGVYFLEISSENTVAIRKVMKL